MTSRRADATTPAPLSAIQGSAPVDFETVVRHSIGNAAAWRSLIKSPENLEPTYWALRKWKDDLKAQRSIRENRRQAGEVDPREHHRWLARQAQFERYVDMRLREIPTFHKSTCRPAPSTAATLRARLREWRNAGSALAVGILAIEEGTGSVEDLSALLDQFEIDMGKLGRVSLRDATQHIARIEREYGTKEN